MNRLPLKRLAIAAALVVCLVVPSAAQSDHARRVREADRAAKRQLELNPELEIMPTRVLVRFKPGADSKLRGAVVDSIGGLRMRSYRLVEGLELIDAPQGWQKAVEALRRNPNILYAVPSRVLRPANSPNDPSFSSLWGMNQANNVDIDAPEAWAKGTGGAVKVAVLDSGVDYTHPDLAANIWTNPDEIPGNGLDDDNNGFVDDVRGWDFFDGDNTPMDTSDHGTHCAGIIGAVGNNGVGVTGVNWSVKIVPLRFLGPSGGDTADAILALEYCAAEGVKISNNSYGYLGTPDIPLRDAIRAAAAQGHLFVAAAGNFGADNDADPNNAFYPASFAEPNLISVAAVESGGGLASFSHYGATKVHLAAPGKNILSTIRGGYGAMEGTSMAAPHVAGGAALVWSMNPGWSYSQIRSRLFSTVKPLGSLAGKCSTGGMLSIGNAMPAGATVVELSFNPRYTFGPDIATGTVTLSLPAPSGGATVTLASGSTAATVPPSVFVPQGSTTATFPVATANATYATRTASISATLGASSQSTDFRVFPNDRSEFVGQSVPKSVWAGHRYPMSFTFKNTGGTTWTAGGSYRAMSRLPNFNSTWGYTTLGLPADAAVAPGQEWTFRPNLTAPSTPGTYDLRWSMMHSGVCYFGQWNKATKVQVLPNDYDAEFVGWKNIMTTQNAGADFTPSITFRNTGTSTPWTRQDGFALQSADGQPTWWYKYLYPSASVAPGYAHTFKPTLVTPLTPGTYVFSWRMSRNGIPFGQQSPLKVVTVVQGPDNAEFVGQTGVPSSVAPGASFSASVTMKNLGTATWTNAGGYSLDSRSPSMGLTWGTNSLGVAPGDSVAPGETYVFSSTFTAPTTPGTYYFHWRMGKNGGATSFGGYTQSSKVTVG